MSFSKNVAVVTGGSTGIGREVVLKLCAQGAKVYNLDIVDVESDACSYIACDVSNYEQVEKAVAQVLDRAPQRSRR